MQISYETERLYLKILPDTAAKEVLGFYKHNKEVFERYEIDRAENFYTEEYQKAMLRCDFNLAVKQLAVRYWVFCKAKPGQVIGTFSFRNVVRQYYQSCELGYKFAPAVWGNGYAGESIAKGIEMVFDDWRLHRIEALVRPDNAPSVRLLERLGFCREGIRRQSIKLHGVWQDHAVYSLLSSDRTANFPNTGTNSQIHQSCIERISHCGSLEIQRERP